MLSPAPHRVILMALVVALLATAIVARPDAATTAGEVQARPQPHPAGLPLPELPGVEDVDPLVVPAPRALERDAVLVDRFTAQGQRVAHPFLAEAGELALLELHAAGYARGWEMAAALRVLAPDGEVLASRTLEGGVQLHALLPFVAPAPGLYRLELEATTRCFRYALVRHGSFAPPSDGPREVGASGRLHGWVASGERVRCRIGVRAGEALAVAVEGTREEARAERHRLLAARAAAAGMRPMGAGGRGAAPRLYPVLDLEVVDGPRPLAAAGAFALLPPAEADGMVEVSVGITSDEPAALFDLVVRRDVPTHAVGGLVVDAGDEPLAGVLVRLLREPDLEPWGQSQTDAHGAWSTRVPAGSYLVELRRPGSAAPQAVSTAVAGDGELNLLWRGE